MKILIVFTVMFLSVPALAADYAITPDCSNNGNGSSWACASKDGGSGAYNTIPTLARGDTAWFAKGTITVNSPYILNVPKSGTAYITFKKATDAAHGPSAGWTSDLGTGQTTFQSTDSGNWVFATTSGTGYYKFDGAYGSGYDPSAYGFVFVFTTTDPSGTLIFVWQGYNPPHMEYYHVAFNSYGKPPRADTLEIGSVATEGGGAYGTYSYCLFKGLDNPIHSPADGGGLLIDHCYFVDHWSAVDHGQCVSLLGSTGGSGEPDNVISNNVFIPVTVGYAGFAGTGAISMNDARAGYPLYNLKMYNNIFAGGTAGAVFQDSSANQGVRNSVFYNNTIVGVGAKNQGKLYTGSASSGNVAKNNLYYGVEASYGVAVGWTHDYNYWDSTCVSNPAPEAHGKTETVSNTDLFVDPANYNYHIMKANSLAVNNADGTLGSPYNVDKDGIARPQGSGWDMGAYEYGPLVVPRPPQNVRVVP